MIFSTSSGHICLNPHDLCRYLHSYSGILSSRIQGSEQHDKYIRCQVLGQGRNNEHLSMVHELPQLSFYLRACVFTRLFTSSFPIFPHIWRLYLRRMTKKTCLASSDTMWERQTPLLAGVTDILLVVCGHPFSNSPRAWDMALEWVFIQHCSFPVTSSGIVDCSAGPQYKCPEVFSIFWIHR